MSKYIKTKDGIYEVGELVETRSAILDKLHTKYYLKQNIIAKGNTIKELCDAFVFEMGAEHTICKLTFEQVRDNIFNCELEDMSRLYGAIWVDGKGLIYVAKMNKTGDLVLI